MTQLDAGWLASMIESSDDAIVSKTLEGIVVSWNPGAERLFGYRAEEMIGRSITTIFPPDRLGEEVEFLATLARGERIEHFETVRVHRDRRPLHVSVTLSPIRNPDGQVVGISKVARDITGRKRAETRLEDRRRWLEAMLASLTDAVIAVDDEGLITFMNPAAGTLTGWAPGEAVGLSVDRVAALLDEESRQPIENPLSQVLRHGQKATLARGALLISRAAVEHPVEASAALIPGDTGGIFGAIVVLHDVTERHRAARVQSHLASIVDTSDDAIISKTLEGLVLSWNHAAERLYGYRDEEMIGRPITTMFPPERVAEEAMFLERIARGERIEHYETVRIRKDGQPIEVSVSLSPIYDPQGRIVAVSKIARDISAQKRLERQRAELLEREQAALQQSKAANRMKDEFIATLSHELRTPINAILGWAQLLASGRLPAAEAVQAVDVIVRNAKLQTQLIDDLLDLSAVVAGRMKLDVRPTDLTTVVQAALDSIRPSAAIKNLELTADLGVGPSIALADGARLQQVVWNLLTNAVKFTPGGGRIDLHLEREDSLARLVVTDTGIGMAADLLPAIFDRFQQGDSSATRRYGGLGLGLAIVRQLVELHGGRVWAESEGSGRGSRFTVELPLVEGQTRRLTDAAQATASAFTQARPLSGFRLLVVDDDKDGLQLVSRLLAVSGATVSEVESAGEALKALEGEPFDCAVIDIAMPDIDGYSLAGHLRDRPNGPPAIALTALVGKADRQRALEAGFRGYLAKPVVVADLIRMVTEVARRSRAGQRPGPELSER